LHVNGLDNINSLTCDFMREECGTRPLTRSAARVGEQGPHLARLRKRFDRVMEHLEDVSEYPGHGRG